MNSWFALPQSTRWAIGVWIALVGGVLGRVAVEKTTSQTVLPIYLEGGKRWANAEPLYAPMPAGLDVYRNPPLIAALTVPFTWLPERATAILWRAIQIGLYFWGLVRCCSAPLSLGGRGVGGEGALRKSTFFIISAVLVLNAFNNAQLNLLIVAAALLGTAAAARGSWWASAFWLTLAAQVKVYPLALAGLVCVVYPRTMIWRSAVLLAAGLLLPCVLANPQYALDQYRGFVHAMKTDDRTDDPIERAPRDWSIVPRAFTGVILTREIVLPVSALAGLACAAWVAFTRREERLPLAFCLSLIWMLLFGPSTEMNTYGILAPVAAYLACRERPNVFAWLGVLLLLVAILRASFPSDPATGMSALQPLGAIRLMAACFVGRAARRAQQE